MHDPNCAASTSTFLPRAPSTHAQYISVPYSNQSITVLTARCLKDRAVVKSRRGITDAGTHAYDAFIRAAGRKGLISGSPSTPARKIPEIKLIVGTYTVRAFCTSADVFKCLMLSFSYMYRSKPIVGSEQSWGARQRAA
jgi:hypothetical protein